MNLAPAVPALAAWSLPFAGILLSIAFLPIIPATASWWERNPNKLLLSAAFAALVCGYYGLRSQGFHAAPGPASVGALLRESVIGDYIPFIVLLFSLFTISGGIRLTGDISARPRTNTAILFLGSVLASLIGTTGASMVLIRPLLQINSERKRTRHTVVFFIFLVSNIGGSLLPVGDPPLFLGFLKGVPFFWSLRLWPSWLFSVGLLLAVYWVLDAWHYAREDQASLRLDQSTVVPFLLRGKANLLLLAGVVLAVAVLVPGQRIPATAWLTPPHLREFIELALCGLSLALTSRALRRANQFNFTAITEVACLFIGIFVTMQVPIELLQVAGPRLGLTEPSRFFWASGGLSSFLDSAPAYAVFFEGAKVLPAAPGVPMLHLLGPGGTIPIKILEAIALGTVVMGANSYLGNGPNFLVKSIAEGQGVRMPTFFGYMVYSGLILIPLFIVMTYLFF
jgi:Na+/H+ antiporter NhaD/arsenite permease-like protein